MADAVTLQEKFSPEYGWSDSLGDALIGDIIKFVRGWSVDDVCVFVCTVDLAANESVGKTIGRKLSKPAKICAENCAGGALNWYADHHLIGIEPVSFYFDLNEPFLNMLHNTWRKWQKAKQEPWSVIEHMGPVSSAKATALQVTDFFAWSANRHCMSTHDVRYRHLWRLISHLPYVEGVLLNEEAFLSTHGRVIRPKANDGIIRL